MIFMLTENAIAKEVVDAAYRVHTTWGQDYWNRHTMPCWPMNCLGVDFRLARQQPIPIVYESIDIDTGFRADLIVGDKVIVEIKSVELLAPVHKKQLLTYLRLADRRPGLLISFHAVPIKDGITSIVNGLEEEFHAKPLSPPG